MKGYAFETLDPEVKALVKTCVCGHDSESHTNTFVAHGNLCGCCISTARQPNTAHNSKAPLVIFRYIKGRAGHFSGSVHV